MKNKRTMQKIYITIFMMLILIISFINETFAVSGNVTDISKLLSDTYFYPTYKITSNGFNGTVTCKSTENTDTIKCNITDKADDGKTYTGIQIRKKGTYTFNDNSGNEFSVKFPNALTNSSGQKIDVVMMINKITTNTLIDTNIVIYGTNGNTTTGTGIYVNKDFAIALMEPEPTVEIAYKFYKAGTQTAISIPSVFVLKNLDVNKKVTVKNFTPNSNVSTVYNKLYTTKTNVVATYNNESGNTTFTSKSKKDTKGNDVYLCKTSTNTLEMTVSIDKRECGSYWEFAQNINTYRKITTKVNNTKYGTITATDSKIENGATKKIEYSPKSEHYRLKSVTVDGASVSKTTYASSYTFSNINEDHTITVEFEPKPYNIIYYMNGGNNNSSNIKTYTIETKETLLDPTKTGYTFAGWYTNANFEGEPITEINNPDGGVLRLYAKWNINKYNVKFNSNSGTEVEDQEIEYQGKVTKPEDPTREGYTFLGWKLNDEDYDFETKITEDITLIADWEINVYTVEFDSDGGTEVESQEREYLDVVSKPADPTRTGYTFAGWKLNGEDYNFETKITENITLVAEWIANKYTVEFDSNGGTEVESQEIEYPEKVTKPVNPTREGYKFVCWKLNGKEYDFESEVTENITLIAEWTISKYIVQFDSNGGTAIESQKIEYQGKAIEPENPTRKGYIFEYWTLDGEKYNFDTKINKDIILIAKWKTNEYLINYHLNDGTNNSSNPTKYTIEDVIILKDATKQGYDFAGWYTDSEYENKIVSIEGNFGNLELYAKWNPSKETPYVVKHNLEKLDGTYEVITETKTGTTEELVTAQVKEYTGFYQDLDKVSKLSGNIAADGSTVLEVYYNRKVYKITYKDEDNVIKTENLKYEQTIYNSNITLSKEGYKFIGWTYSDNGKIVDLSKDMKASSDLELKAKWEKIINDKPTDETNGTDKTVENSNNHSSGTKGNTTAQVGQTSGSSIEAENTNNNMANDNNSGDSDTKNDTSNKSKKVKYIIQYYKEQKDGTYELIKEEVEIVSNNDEVNIEEKLAENNYDTTKCRLERKVLNDGTIVYEAYIEQNNKFNWLWLILIIVIVIVIILYVKKKKNR